MANTIKKRGRKIIQRLTRASTKARVESKEHIKENFLQRLSHIKSIRLLVFEWVLLAIVLIVLSISQAVWFVSSYAEERFTDGGSYIEATVGKVNSMNPLFATTDSERVLSRLMFSTLTATDYSGHPGLGLANFVKASDDGKIWTVRLRDNLMWSDGEPITTDDVLFTIELIQNPAVTTIYGPNLENVKVTKGDGNDLIFTLPSAYADFATALEIPIVPKHELEDANLKTLVEDDFSLAPVTSGAFSFNAIQTTSSASEEVIYLSANPYYYLGRPMLNSFAIHTYDDRASVVSAINNGAVTATAELAESDMDMIVSSSFYKRETKINAGVFMFFNTSSGALKSVELRRAIRQGVDIDNIRAAAPGTSALDYPLLDSQIKLDNYPAIPEKAIEDVDEVIDSAGGETQLTLNIVTVKSGYLPAVAEALKTELEGLGIIANLTTYEETQEFIANIVSHRSYDILIYEIEMGADPDLLPYYHSSQASSAGLNLSNYRNSLVDDLLIGARETLDTTLRARKYESFLNYWVSDVPAVGIYQANLTYIYNKNVQTYNETIILPSGIDRFMDVENWATVKALKNLTP